jgi:hypothetical protein
MTHRTSAGPEIASATRTAGRSLPPGTWAGILHIYVAFDWGDEIDLERARRLILARVHELPRRRRTPPSIAYRPAPLRLEAPMRLPALPWLGAVEGTADVTLFDFAAVSVAFHVPLRTTADGLRDLADSLADPSPVVQAARAGLEPLHRQLLPAIQKPEWRDGLSEEYFVFQLTADGGCPTSDLLHGPHAGWLAGLLRLEAGPLSDEEVAEALRLHLSYSPHDLLVPDWGAAVLFDRDCEETLQTIEFANLQLLEFRHLDNRLDDSLAEAYRMIHPLVESRLPFWRVHARPLRAVGELNVEANSLFERTGNVLKLVGDQYLARVYRLLVGRFHLEEWERSIQRKLEIAEGVYQVISDQAASYRTEFLEIVVILLILLEILLALFRH